MKKMIHWKFAAIRLLVFTVVFCGTTVLSSCSGDDKSSLDVRMEFESDLQETINNIMQRSNSDMKAADTHYDLDVDRNGYQIDFTQLRTGSLEYKDMRFAMERTQHNIDSVVDNFVYNKDGSEVLGIKMKSKNNLSLEKLLQHDVVFNSELELCINDGMLKLESNVDNMNKFYLASIGLAEIGIAGSSQENCQKQADAFNAVVNSKLSLFGVEQGVVMIEPVTTDSVSNIYRPELVLQLTYDGEKIILKNFFEGIGLSFKDIIEMISGQ